MVDVFAVPAGAVVHGKELATESRTTDIIICTLLARMARQAVGRH
jgi:hypothetical protein